MHWPIPPVPEYPSLAPPRYRRWLSLLVLLSGAGVAISSQFYPTDNIPQALLYGTIPAFFLWLTLFGAVLNRYGQSRIASSAWQEASEETHYQWEVWAQKQLAVVGNLLLTPEKNGVAALFAKGEERPLFPHRGRPLFNPLSPGEQLFSSIDEHLEQQHPGYRHGLHTIYIADALNNAKLYSKTIHQHWGIQPTGLDDISLFTSLYDTEEIGGVILVIGTQLWPDQREQPYSEFVCAQLVTSPDFARANNMPVLAGLGRPMTTTADELMPSLDKFIDYALPQKQFTQAVWLCGTAKELPGTLAIYAHEQQQDLLAENRMISVDMAFGQPGPLACLYTSSMLTDAVALAQNNQIMINQSSAEQATLCLITRNLLK